MREREGHREIRPLRYRDGGRRGRWRAETALTIVRPPLARRDGRTDEAVAAFNKAPQRGLVEHRGLLEHDVPYPASGALQQSFGVAQARALQQEEVHTHRPGTRDRGITSEARSVGLHPMASALKLS
jgi:hypothetical protein